MPPVPREVDGVTYILLCTGWDPPTFTPDEPGVPINELFGVMGVENLPYS